MSDAKASLQRGTEYSDQVTVALVCKYAPGGNSGLEHHLDMLLRHVQTSSCCYELVTGSEGEHQRSRGARGYLRFVGRLIRIRSELLHFQGFDRLQLLTLILFARGRIPLVVTPHNGVAGIVNDRMAVRRLVKRWVDGLLFPLLIRQRARIIALSTEERDYYLRRFPRCSQLVDLLPNPVEAQSWKPLSPVLSPPRLLALARLSPVKHIEDLLSALALLPPEVECDVAGPDYGAAAALKSQAGQMARTIRFHGAVWGAEKERLFDHATVVVITTEVEGLSTVALEALARGIPVVASEGGARGLPAEGVYRYRFGSIAALAGAIEHLLAEDNLVKARLAARRASAGLIGYDGYAQALRSLYRTNLQLHRGERSLAARNRRRRPRISPREHRPA